MLYFHTTAKLAKSLKIKLPPAPNADDIDWLDNWYANVLDVGLPLKILIFTNAETRYCLVHPFDARDDLDYIVDIFRMRLQEHTGRDLSAQHSEYQFCKTNSRKVLGCMNDLAMMLEHCARDMWDSGEGVNLEKIEVQLNRGIVAGKFIQDEFDKMLGREKTRLKPTHIPHLKVVE
ncbi:DUF6933 domain-containing protein [Terasakiella pusilla]|uniref:DUF6933 domain-containing protein n=1 Tax=Terasakiella pusilla TaxID=64973 RepID=UPI003AA88CED